MERISTFGFNLAVLCLVILEIACDGHTHISNNIQSEQKALIDFKNSLSDPNNILSSWKGSNYCYWEGIDCENGTFVVSIDLRNPYPYPSENVYENQSLSGVISPSLVKLKYLKHLDLSFNSFKAIPIPQFIGSLKNLMYLNLSQCGFIGAIPSNLGNLSNLQYLDISSAYTYLRPSYGYTYRIDYVYSSDLFIENIEWVTNLVSLKHLSANNVNLSMIGSQWIEVLNKLPILTELHLDGCSLFGSIPSPSFVNFTALTVISISSNEFNSAFPEWLLNVGSLEWVDISSNKLHGRIPFGFSKLPNLQYLDLSINYHLEGDISELLRKGWRKIEFLDLSANYLHGSIPSSIGNFCNLQYLNLRANKLNGSLPEIVNGYETCNSKSPLPNLRELDLSGNQLQGSIPSSIGNFCNLQYLRLSNNQLNGSLPKIVNGYETCNSKSPFPNLRELDLSYNQLRGSIPSSIGNFCNLQYLNLGSNNLNGSLPEIINGYETCNSNSPLPNLRELDLYDNQLTGKLPKWLGELKSLWTLILSYKKLEGPIPRLEQLEFLYLEGNELNGSMLDSIGQLSQLKVLNLYSNQLSGNLSEKHFSKLSQLESLFLYLLRLNVSSNWVPPFKLRTLNMVSCDIGPAFPAWLQSQKNLRSLRLFNASISSFIPNWFGNISFNMEELVLSDNQLQGSVPSFIGNLSNLYYLDFTSNRLSGTLSEQHFWKLNQLRYLLMGSNSFRLDVSSNWTPPFQLEYLYMSSCRIGPTFPGWLQSQNNLIFLNLSNASISSSIPNWFWNISSNMKYLILPHNQLHGPLPNSNIGDFLPKLLLLSLSGNRIGGMIPDSIGHLSSLEVVDFSSNNLIGSIPSTISNCSYLTVLDLGNNNLSGMIPKSLSQLQYLESLHLNHNELFGELPSSLQNLTSLDVLDLSYNKLWGQMPAWIGTAFPNLVILNLRSNMFSGRLPFILSNLSSLHVLDLAQNHMTGEIPITLVELNAMAQEQLSIYQLSMNASTLYDEILEVTTKGQIYEYSRILSLLVSIDLSDNNFSGEFPKGLTKLIGLVFLNLSMNHIIGQIPESISKLHQLSSLDLSNNKLFGSIPSSMSSLSFLGYLNLSNNNFSGMIPFIGHMSTFTESTFTGNPNLCGTPLVIKCPDEDSNKRQSDVEDKLGDDYIDQWFYLSIGLGFAMGILVPYFVFAMKRSWSDAYFDFVDKIVKWLFFERRVTYARNHAQKQ